MGERQGTETRDKREETKDKGQRTKDFETLRLQEVKILGLQHYPGGLDTRSMLAEALEANMLRRLLNDEKGPKPLSVIT